MPRQDTPACLMDSWKASDEMLKGGRGNETRIVGSALLENNFLFGGVGGLKLRKLQSDVTKLIRVIRLVGGVNPEASRTLSPS